jgi:hypothetical protein
MPILLRIVLTSGSEGKAGRYRLRFAPAICAEWIAFQRVEIQNQIDAWLQSIRALQNGLDLEASGECRIPRRQEAAR